MGEPLDNFYSWRYRDINSKERQAYHYMVRLEIQNKDLKDRIKNVTFEFQGITKKQRDRIEQLKSELKGNQ